MPAQKPEPVRPIRALLRGLDALAELSAEAGLTVSETARRARLPRTTAYRVLETLRLGGYVTRDEAELYRATAKGELLKTGGRARRFAPETANGQSANGHGPADAS